LEAKGKRRESDWQFEQKALLFVSQMVLVGACRIPLFVAGVLVIGTVLVGPSIGRLFTSVERSVHKGVLTLQRHQRNRQSWSPAHGWLALQSGIFPICGTEHLQKSTDFAAVLRF